MKNLKLLLLLLCSTFAIAQNPIGTVNINGTDVELFYKIKTQVTTPPVVVTPPVITTPPATAFSVVNQKADDCLLEKKKISFNVVGGSGNYEIRYGGFPNFWYPSGAAVSFDMNTKSDWSIYIKDKNLGKTLKVAIQSGSCFSKAIFDSTVDGEPVIAPPIVEPPVIEQTQTQTTATTSNRPLIGAVRWDWWADNFECTTKWLSPNKWHYKAPFFAKETSENSLELKGNTQEIFDKELEYANYAGIDYFAFDWYSGENALWNGAYGRTLFKSSTKKGNMKMCYILEATSLGGDFNSQTLKNICTDFGREDYQKINGRPLFFYMTYPPLTPKQVDAINNTYSAIYPNAPLPYIVNAIQVGVQEAQMNNGTGIAAWSQYTGYSLQGDIKMRERYKEANVKLIPTLTVGWDTRPIAEQPCSWYQNAPYETEYRLTGDALKSHLTDTINFVKANPTICEANTILVYAWNENAEGGYMVPTLIPGTNKINTDTIEIFRQVLNPSQKEQ